MEALEPNWLASSPKGWVETKFLDKGDETGKGKYHGRVLSMALIPYTQAQYPNLYSQYKAKLPAIENMRLHAAEMAIDSGGCVYNTTTKNVSCWL